MTEVTRGTSFPAPGDGRRCGPRVCSPRVEGKALPVVDLDRHKEATPMAGVESKIHRNRSV
jgi:hypothetical protein